MSVTSLIPAVIFFAIVLLVKMERDISGYRFKMAQVRGCLSNEFGLLTPTDKNYLHVWERGFWKLRISILRYKMGYMILQIVTIGIASALLFSAVLIKACSAEPRCKRNLSTPSGLQHTIDKAGLQKTKTLRVTPADEDPTE